MQHAISLSITITSSLPPAPAACHQHQQPPAAAAAPAAPPHLLGLLPLLLLGALLPVCCSSCCCACVLQPPRRLLLGNKVSHAHLSLVVPVRTLRKQQQQHTEEHTYQHALSTQHRQAEEHSSRSCTTLSCAAKCALLNAAAASNRAPAPFKPHPSRCQATGFCKFSVDLSPPACYRCTQGCKRCCSKRTQISAPPPSPPAAP